MHFFHDGFDPIFKKSGVFGLVLYNQKK